VIASRGGSSPATTFEFLAPLVGRRRGFENVRLQEKAGGDRPFSRERAGIGPRPDDGFIQSSPDIDLRLEATSFS